jgi:hypothetical protein
MVEEGRSREIRFNNEVFTLTGDVYDSKRVAGSGRTASQSAKGNLVELRETSGRKRPPKRNFT